MKYSDLTSYPRDYDATRYPIITHIEIEAVDFERFERRAADQTQIVILGHDHDLADDDRLVVHVGCASEKVKSRLERLWA
jgi:hypothetical protein